MKAPRNPPPKSPRNYSGPKLGPKSPTPGRAPYKPREPGSLKEATALLVQACGGIERAAIRVRVGKSALARYSDPAEDATYIPADVIRALEFNCGEPIVTRYLAAEQGCSLSCVKYDPTPAALAEDMAALAADTGALFGDCGKALAAGPAEFPTHTAGRLIADIDQTIAVLFHMRGRLNPRSSAAECDRPPPGYSGGGA